MATKIKMNYKDKLLQVKIIETKLEDDTEGPPVISVRVLKGVLDKSEINDMMIEVKKQLKIG